MASGFMKISKPTMKGDIRADYLARHNKFSGIKDIVHWEDGNLIGEFRDAASFFWQAARQERSNARVYHEIMISVPREAPDPVSWSRNFVQELLGDRHPYRFALHIVTAKDGLPNPNLHIMLSARTHDGIKRGFMRFFRRANKKAPHLGGAVKDPIWGKRTAFLKVRNLLDEHIRKVLPDWQRPIKKRNKRNGPTPH
jgi:hypothetical protein